MKTITTLSVSIAAIITSYAGIDTSFSQVSTKILKSDPPVITFAPHCPDNKSVISRNLREEGIVSKIKSQSVSTTRAGEIKKTRK